MSEHTTPGNDANRPCTVQDIRDIIAGEVGRLERAFPDGVEGHRSAHEHMIAASKAEEAFWRELKMDIVKKGVWGLLIVIVGLIVVGFGAKMGIALK